MPHANANLTRAETAERAAHIRIDSYRVEVDLSQAKDTSVPTYPSRSTIVFDADCESTWLDFIGPRVAEITLNGEALDPGQRVDGDRITLPGLIQGRNEVSVLVDAAYSRSGEGLHRFTDADGLVYTYTQYEPADCRRVFANMEQPDLKAKFTFVLTGPAEWQLLTNQHEVSRETSSGPDGELATVTYAETLPQSTYITCIVAGPYHRADDVWTARGADGSTREIALGALCRQSLAEHFDADEIFTLTKQGFDFFEEKLDYPYPWGIKYDQVFVPEYNLGAMENPGLVTYTDAYVFRSAATDAQYAARANTLLHEMSHMWFGDLVTMKWWDDLWLKESFADFMGSFASAEATKHTTAWTAFASGRKAWAYLQDQYPTTHPIVANILDLEAAKQNFDGITYAKGASVLKQLVAYVGEDRFLAGAQAYFKEHEFGNTVLEDLLVELEKTSGRDLREWSRLWLQTTGVSEIVPTVDRAEDGTISRLLLSQSCEGQDGPVVRPHRLVVGLYSLDSDGVPQRTARIETDLIEQTAEVADAVGQRADLVVVNDEDWTFAKVRLDPQSVETATRTLAKLEPVLTRALVWSSLWNSVRDGLVDPRVFIDAVLSQGPGTPSSSLLRTITGQAVMASRGYLPASARDGACSTLLRGAWAALDAAEPGSDEQITWARLVADAAMRCNDLDDQIIALLDGSHVIDGLRLDPDLRWTLVQGLAATGRFGEAEIAAERERDHSSEGLTAYLRSMAARPTPETKAEAWAAAVERDDLSNDHLSATIDGFMAPGHGALRAEYADRYFAVIGDIWRDRSIEMAGRVVRGLFPADADLSEEADAAIEEHPSVRRAQAWLDGNADAPRALRRLVIEATDEMQRQLRSQASVVARG